MTIKVQNTEETYQAAAVTAKAASEAADVALTPELHHKAAALQLAASTLAKAAGRGTEMELHDKRADFHIDARRRCMEGKPTKAAELEAAAKVKSTPALQAEQAADSTDVDENDYDSKKKYAINKTTVAHAASHAAETSSYGHQHDHAANAHDEAAGAHELAGQNVPESELQLKQYHADMVEMHKESATKHRAVHKAISELNSKAAKDPVAMAAKASARMQKQGPLMAGIKDGGYSFQDLQDKLRGAVNGLPQFKATDGQPTLGGWVADIICPEHEEGETWEAIVSGQDGKLYCVQFTLGVEEGVSIVGDPTEVEKETDYEYVYGDEPKEAVAKAHVTTPALEASTSRHARYHAAALEAHKATAAIPKAHQDAASLHSIAAEHAKMNRMTAEHDGHMEKYRGHLAALEACNSMAAASAKETEALEAGGPGSGPHQGGSSWFHEAGKRSEHAADMTANIKQHTAKVGTAYANADARHAHSVAGSAHQEVAKEKMASGDKKGAAAHTARAESHFKQARVHAEAEKVARAKDSDSYAGSRD